MNTNILYIGAGTHLEPIIHLNSHEYVFVDIQPRSEYEVSEYEVSEYEVSEYDVSGYWDCRLYRKNFFLSLIAKAKKLKFKLDHIISLNMDYFNSLEWRGFNTKDNEYNSVTRNYDELEKITGRFPYSNPTLLIFTNPNTGQILKYYISTNITTNMCKMLSDDIKKSFGLIICGYHPNGQILKYLRHPINLYCYDKTIYKYNEEDIDEPDNLIYWCWNNLSIIPSYFNQIYTISRKTGEIIQCENFIHMNEIVISRQ
jgi:hypothetical protein